MENHTRYEDFVLLGFLIGHKAEISVAMVLLAIYFLTLSGNISILIIIATTTRLHTPMYFFLGNLSVLDLAFSTVTVPIFLRNLLSGIKTISFAGCMAQSYCYFFLSTVEYFLLTCMSYDRYVAICNPLRYSAIMNSHVCVQAVLLCWVGGFFSVLYPTIIITRLSYCKSNIIDHFFCDSEPLLQLSCTDIRLIQLVTFVLSSVVILSSLALTVISYLYIVSAILRIPTGAGRKKAFNTCASHLTLFLMSTAVSILLYVIPSEKSSLGARKIPALLSSIVNPFLIPFIYTLRNDLVKGILGEIFGQGKAAVAQKMQKLLRMESAVAF
ncbi:olfactory receptor 6J1-like [Eublepharis macularius]|uniref:Olfactory receptor n=1 Tax=Eublepharis macularius TaxID=481883 RepID=A0AA97K418_EUBMA|nr:olfactory receptor 6J1-like [Eublepharis macularius]